MKKFFYVETDMLMRAGKYSDLYNEYSNNRITFSCPANWIDYAFKQHQCKVKSGIEDWYECAFAHVDKSFDERAVINGTGEPLGNNLLCLVSSIDGSKFLTQIPIILTPVLCFFSFGDIGKRILAQEDHSDRIGFNLVAYLHNLGFKEECMGYLFITDFKAFNEELVKQVPIAIKKNESNLNVDAFTTPFDAERPIIMNQVDYNKHKISELFYINDYFDAMFWKDKSFEYQSEVRAVIPNVNFNQRYPCGNYDYTKNLLSVDMPNLQNYAVLLSAEEINHISFRLEKSGDKEVKFTRAQ